MRDQKLVGGNSGATFLHDVVPALGLGESTKRMLDIVLATMGLVFLAPILLITSVAIKLETRGPIFVRKIPYGHKIHVLNFRLVTGAASHPVNPTMTRVGRFLSGTGADELPQLFNVLRGEMSIVGRKNIHRWRVSIH